MARKARIATAEVADHGTAQAEEIGQGVADGTDLPDGPPADPASHERPSFTQREQVRRPDPFDSQAVRWPDGYQIKFQESQARETVEVQFGDGGRADQPKNFGPIKEYLKSEGMKWNGSNAWVLDLEPVRGSQGDRNEAKKSNREIRTHVEDVILPRVVELEEEVRGKSLSEPVKRTEARGR